METGTLPPPEGAAPADSLEAHLLEYFANHSRRVPLVATVLLGVIAVVAYGRVAPGLIAGWLALSLAIMIVRAVLLPKLARRHDLTMGRRHQLAVLLSGLNGVAHGLALAAFPQLSLGERYFISVLLVGHCTGGVGTTAGDRPVFLAYMVPTMVPLALMWLWSPGLAAPTRDDRLLGLLIGLYVPILLEMARNANRSFVESYRIRFAERELNRRLQAALESAVDANNAKTRFLAAASHDLRQPLQSLSLLIAALGMRPLDDRSRHIVQLAEQASDALTTLLNSLLDISKLDAGVVRAVPKRVDLRALLLDHAAQIRAAAEERHLALVCEAPARCMVDTDPQLLGRIIHNLTDNAIKFTEQGRVTLRLDQSSGWAHLTVEDTGLGIPLSEQRNVFREFFQLDNPQRDRDKGLGLGLSIVERLCALLGARLSLESQVGGGSRFVVSLPLAEDGPLGCEAASSPMTPRPGLKILILDDERLVRTSMRVLLEQLGCDCAEASTTAQAIEVAAAFGPDMLFADFRLRDGEDGLTAIRSLRARWPQLRAVLISGDTAPNRLQEAQAAGVPLLHKPIGLAALGETLARAEESPA